MAELIDIITDVFWYQIFILRSSTKMQFMKFMSDKSYILYYFEYKMHIFHIFSCWKNWGAS
jgi:hypothetical protein